MSYLVAMMSALFRRDWPVFRMYFLMLRDKFERTPF